MHDRNLGTVVDVTPALSLICVTNLTPNNGQGVFLISYGGLGVYVCLILVTPLYGDNSLIYR